MLTVKWANSVKYSIVKISDILWKVLELRPKWEVVVVVGCVGGELGI